MRVGLENALQNSVLSRGAYSYAKVPVNSVLSKGTYSCAKVPVDAVWSWNPRETPPDQLRMSARAGSEMISEHESLYVKKTRRKYNWFLEIIGYKTQSDFNIATDQNRENDIMYAREDSSMCLRIFCQNLHPWNMTVWHGHSAEGLKLGTFHRPWGCIPTPMKCCCYQQIRHNDTNGEFIGLTTEDFYCCVPKFKVTDSMNHVEFIISRPSCWGGLCIDCFSGGGMFTWHVPFYVYPADSKLQEEDAYVGTIRKAWYGNPDIRTNVDRFELCTNVDSSGISFPEYSDADSKVRLLGSLFLINQLYFETRLIYCDGGDCRKLVS